MIFMSIKMTEYMGMSFSFKLLFRRLYIPNVKNIAKAGIAEKKYLPCG